MVDDEEDEFSELDELNVSSLKRESEKGNYSAASGPGLTSTSFDKFSTLSRWYDALLL